MKLSDNALLTGHANGKMVKQGFILRDAMLAVVDGADGAARDLGELRNRHQPGRERPPLTPLTAR